MLPVETRRPLKVLHLIKGLGRGGAEVLLTSTLRAAARRDVEYEYGYLLARKAALVPELETLGAKVTLFDGPSIPRLVRAAFAVSAYLTRARIDLVHAHLPIAGVVARIAGRLARVPVVYTEHNVAPRYNEWTRRANQWTWAWQKAVIAVSTEVAAATVREMRGQTVPIRVIPNGVDLQKFDPGRFSAVDAKRAIGLEPDTLVLGTVAVFRTQKRLQDWIVAATQVLRRLPEAHCVLVGDGAPREGLIQQARQGGIEDRVHFVGMQMDVRPFLAAMDVYMMSSTFEGLPVAMLEAMAMERPVVATAVGGIPEVLQSTCGVLVDVGHPGTLADVAERLLRDPAERRKLGRAGRARVRDGFSVGRMVTEIEQVYRQAVATNA